MLNKVTKIFLLLFITASFLWAYESNLVTAQVSEANGDLIKLNQIIKEHETLLKKYPQGGFSATIMFQLAELHEEKATLEYYDAMDKYEKKLDRFDKGEISTEPIEPQINLEKTVDYCKRLLSEHPNNVYRDKIIYKLGYAHQRTGQDEIAKNLYEKLITDYPDSDLVPETAFRLGEYYFDKRDYKTAITQYQDLLNSWNTTFFNMALYKLGWSYYNLSDYTNAVSTFIYLIEDISLLKSTQSQVIGATKVDLRSESIHYIASSFTEFSSAPEVKEFFEPMKQKNYTLPILLKIGELYQKRNFYTEANDIYKVIMDIYPYYYGAPELFNKIIENTELETNTIAANQEREKIVEQFGPDSQWAQNQQNSDQKSSGLLLAQNTLFELGTFYQNKAQTEKSDKDYQIAIEKYKEYLKKFPNSKENAKVLYLIAESFYGLNKLEEAAKTYHKVSEIDSTSEMAEEAAYNRIICYYQLCSDDQFTADSTEILLANFLNSQKSLQVTVNNQYHQDLLNACNDFYVMFPKSKWLTQVLMNYGETLHLLSSYLPSVDVYKQIIKIDPKGPYHLPAAMNAGQCYLEGEHYDQAQNWFSVFLKTFPDSTRYLDKANLLWSSASYKMAEKFAKENKPAEAAEIFNDIAENTKDANFHERALLESATQYRKSSQYSLASRALERLVRIKPPSALSPEVLYKAAGMREQSEEWTLAALNYEQLADNYPGDKLVLPALKSAAICYETNQSWFLAQRVHTRIINTFPDNGEQVIESKFRIAEISYNEKDIPQAETELLQVIDDYNRFNENGQYVDSYFVSQAQFLLSEISYKDYCSFNLDQPLEVNLKIKVQKLQTVLKSFKQTLVYQVADWSTAASHRIGMTFEEFVRAFIEAPVPDGLSEEELALYTEKITETVRPYKEKALEAYQANIDQAELNAIENSWVDKSRERVKELSLELGLVEQVTDAVEEEPSQEEPDLIDENISVVKGS